MATWPDSSIASVCARAVTHIGNRGRFTRRSSSSASATAETPGPGESKLLMGVKAAYNRPGPLAHKKALNAEAFSPPSVCQRPSPRYRVTDSLGGGRGFNRFRIAPPSIGWRRRSEPEVTHKLGPPVRQWGSPPRNCPNGICAWGYRAGSRCKLGGQRDR